MSPLTPSHLCTAPPAHASGAAVSSSLEQQQQPSYAPTSYGQSPGARPSSYYHQHSVEPSDPMQWSDDARTMPTTPLFAQKPSHAGHIHAPHTSPFPLAVRQRDFPNHHGGSNNGSSSSGGGGNNVEGKQCEQCGTMRSPEWRRGPSGHKTLCNACGLRYSRSLARAGKVAQNQRNASLASQSTSGQRPLEPPSIDTRAAAMHTDMHASVALSAVTPTFSSHFSAPSTPTGIASAPAAGSGTMNTTAASCPSLPHSMAMRPGPMHRGYDAGHAMALHSSSASHPTLPQPHHPYHQSHPPAYHAGHSPAAHSDWSFAGDNRMAAARHYAAGYPVDSAAGSSARMSGPSDGFRLDGRDIPSV
ncbi:hypothetical protein SYNPS1DRAFT_31880 [Syncephalis pseudoplumigaleata]|uniref:GATA-type domain-containing protein n=1 Tax=Syncephalis pseudoplumigaleata TaxID=1712513 RepID=A0A4P9YS86_9FUNG|nr:hypothetical protein SYNPS1DRAFT_31880 [Syncephalis pseudoplumigaleata]|eukprot:RKP22518.1 hypothetical protein SYNPS1DRAFT_31880 [Syncephalis pseudoplumigaleata]